MGLIRPPDYFRGTFILFGIFLLELDRGVLVMSFEERYMLRAIELAKKGAGAVNPNPLVGAVIVKDGRIIGEGYHERYGELHAERNAFKNLTEDAEGAEMYVTLEPCSHYGKQPPCCIAVVEHKIKTIYVGSDDPNEQVSGKGFEYLREHGVEVHTHMMKKECDALNYVFFHYITTKTPYVVMKYAMTIDGKIATKTGKSKWISGEESRNRVQRMRNELTGIMVGINTVLSDDPMLNCRIPETVTDTNRRNPVRIVVDSRLRIPIGSRLVQSAMDIPLIVATSERNLKDASEKEKELLNLGVKVLPVPEREGGLLNLSVLMKELGNLKIDGILLEGGGTLNYSMLEEGLINELRVFVSPKIFGGRDAKSPVMGCGIDEVKDAFEFVVSESETVGEDIMITLRKRIE